MAKRFLYWLGLGIITTLLLIFIGKPWGPMAAIAQNDNTMVSLTAPQLGPTTYQDPGGRFAVNILEGYELQQLAGTWFVESPDQTLAYTVAVKPQANNRDLNNSELAQTAIDVLLPGEGFVPGPWESLGPNGMKFSWQGRLGKQPVGGQVFAQQVPNNVVVLVVAGPVDRQEAVATITDLLIPTVQAL